jgi:hypothetical protein
MYGVTVLLRQKTQQVNSMWLAAYCREVYMYGVTVLLCQKTQLFSVFAIVPLTVIVTIRDPSNRQ